MLLERSDYGQHLLYILSFLGIFKFRLYLSYNIFMYTCLFIHVAAAARSKKKNTQKCKVSSVGRSSYDPPAPRPQVVVVVLALSGAWLRVLFGFQ